MKLKKTEELYILIIIYVGEGIFQDFWGILALFLALFWKTFGNFLADFWGIFGPFFGNFLALFKPG
jgi:hypothetical protein